MAVVAALKLYDLVSPGVSTRQANRTHGGFCAGGHQADLFDGRHQFTDLAGYLDFGFGGSTVAQTFFQLLLQCRDYRGVAMTQY